jgi:hypothetical protein
MNDDRIPPTLNDTIDPKHLLQAIQNSMQHSDETAHAVTGLHFKDYSILVRKRKGLCWLIKCKRSKSVERQRSRAAHVDVGS